MKRYAPLLPLALLLSCATTERPPTENPAVSMSPPAPAVNRAFDVPALIGMNADQIAKPLTGQSIRPDHDRTLSLRVYVPSFKQFDNSEGNRGKNGTVVI